MLIFRAWLCSTSNVPASQMSSLSCSESTAGSCRWWGSEFQTDYLATENAPVLKVLRWTRGNDSGWRLAHAGDQELRRLAYSNRRGTLELSAKDNDGLSQQACTALSEVQPVSAGCHASAERDHTHISGSMWPDVLHHSILNMLQYVHDLRCKNCQSLVLVMLYLVLSCFTLFEYEYLNMNSHTNWIFGTALLSSK